MKYFWCAGSKCGYQRHPLSELAQSLENKKLCRLCFDADLRLKIGVVVTVQVVKGK